MLFLCLFFQNTNPISLCTDQTPSFTITAAPHTLSAATLLLPALHRRRPRQPPPATTEHAAAHHTAASSSSPVSTLSQLSVLLFFKPCIYVMNGYFFGCCSCPCCHFTFISYSCFNISPHSYFFCCKFFFFFFGIA